MFYLTLLMLVVMAFVAGFEASQHRWWSCAIYSGGVGLWVFVMIQGVKTMVMSYVSAAIKNVFEQMGATDIEVKVSSRAEDN